MTYRDSENSVHGGKPVELFRYLGTYENFRYTSAPRKVTFQAPDEDEPHDYLPLTMRRSPITATTQNDSTGEVTIEMPVNTPLVEIYGFQISPPQLHLTIYRGHAPGEFVRYWSGQVENVQVEGGLATVRVPSALAAALSSDVPNVFFQTPCNHNLFDARCKVPREDWSAETTVVAIDGKQIELAAIGAPLTGNLVGGELLLSSGERRMIVGQAGTTVSINYPFASIAVDDVVELAVGCNLAWKGDCKTRFNNTVNFGGFPLIPPKNIFATGLEPGKNVADEACLPTYVPWDIKIEFNFVPGVSGGPPLSFPGLGNHNINVDGPLFPNGNRISAGQNLTASLGAENYDLGDGGPLCAVIRDYPSGVIPDQVPGQVMAAFRRVLTGDGSVISYIWYFFFTFSGRFGCSHQFAYAGTYPGVGALTAVNASGHALGMGGEFDSSPFQANYGHLFPYSYYVDL